MIRLLSRTAALVMTLMLMLIVLRGAGSLDKPFAVMLLDAEGCKAPCWNGIRPGETTLEQAEARLRADPSVVNVASTPSIDELCWSTLAAPFWRSCARRTYRATGGAVERLTLELPPDALLLGDAIAVFGNPVAVEQCPVRNIRLAGVPRQFIGTYVSFGNNTRLMVYDARDAYTQVLTPDMVVLRILYYSPAAMRPTDYAERWQGFASVARLHSTCRE